MLTLTVSTLDLFDEEKNEFLSEGFTLNLEHSLASLSKWESFFEKPFLSEKEHSKEEALWYINAMVQPPFPPEDFLEKLKPEHIEQINNYMTSKMTATWFKESKPTGRKEIITAEVIYYWMTSFNIPFECQYWHLNRLLTLIQVCMEKSKPPKKLSRQEMAVRNAEMNAARIKKYGTRG